MNRVTGLPVLVADRWRIVINFTFRNFFHIPESGQVRVLVSRDMLQVFPMSSAVPGAVLKDISAGRLNLPADWARANDVKPGDYVLMVATADCLLIQPVTK